ncbi:putative dCMP deaminase [Medicago truncatula]|uniref:dCMP deaminase n=1 Tax=Medicago truncatula TaxID=3880 RepID=A0A396I4W7_MEDTR|nr:putative dCMP deaminase [Medicago truncatula]
MNSREVTLVATATAFGALASAIALHFFYRSQTHSSKTKSSQNGTISSSRVRSSGDPFDPTKRKGYLSWDDYFMAITFLSAERSKDPNRQVGACLVSQDDIILGIGYNEFPRGCSDDKLPWAKKSRTGNHLETKYPYVCHAESGDSEVIYFVEKKLENSDVTYTASHKLLSLAGVKVRKLQPVMSEIHLKYEDH